MLGAPADGEGAGHFPKTKHQTGAAHQRALPQAQHQRETSAQGAAEGGLSDWCLYVCVCVCVCVSVCQ